MIIAIEGALIQVVTISDVHLVMGTNIIKENVKAVASFQVADELEWAVMGLHISLMIYK